MLHEATPADSESDTIAGRKRLKKLLVELLPVAQAMDARDVVDAAEICIDVLNTPGAISTSACLPLVLTVHERIAPHLRRGAVLATGKLRQTLTEAAARADAAALQIRTMLTREGTLPS